MKIFSLFFLLLMSGHLQAQKRKVSIESLMFFNKTYGHIYKSPNSSSQSFSTISCGHPVKVLSLNGKKIWGRGFQLVKAGPYKGYISKDNLSEREDDCLQDRYPRFFNALNLSISDMYYWGKLQGHYDKGESQAR